MKKYLILLTIFLLVPMFLFGQILDIKKGQSVIYSWEEVTTDTSGNPLQRSDIYYQMYAAPFIDGVADWSQQELLFSPDWQPVIFDSSRAEIMKPVILDKERYQLVLTAYRYDSNGVMYESEPSSELIIFNMIDEPVPPRKPGDVSVIQTFN